MQYQSGDLMAVQPVQAVAGLVFSLCAMVQFFTGTIDLGALGLTITQSQAMVPGIVALVVAFASSENRQWHYYQTWEKAIIVLAVALMLLHNYVYWVELAVSNNQPVGGIIAFGLGMTAWLLLQK